MKKRQLKRLLKIAQSDNRELCHQLSARGHSMGEWQDEAKRNEELAESYRVGAEELAKERDDYLLQVERLEGQVQARTNERDYVIMEKNGPSEMAHMQSEADRIAEDASNWRQKAFELGQQVASLQASLAQYCEANAAQVRTIERLSVHLTQAQAHVSSREHQDEEISHQMVALNLNVEEAFRVRDELRERLTWSEGRREDLHSQAVAARKQAAELERRVSSIVADHEASQKQLMAVLKQPCGCIWAVNLDGVEQCSRCGSYPIVQADAIAESRWQGAALMRAKILDQLKQSMSNMDRLYESGALRGMELAVECIEQIESLEDHDEPKPEAARGSGSRSADETLSGLQSQAGRPVPQQGVDTAEATREADEGGQAARRREVRSIGEIRWSEKGSWTSVYQCHACGCLMLAHVEVCGRCE